MNIEIKDGAAFLRGSITPELMSLIGGFEGRRSWLKDGRLKFEPTKFNFDLLTHVPNIVIDNKDLIETDNSELEALLGEGKGISWTPKREPREYQLRALNRAREQRHFGLFLEQGLGKTKVIIDRACELRSKGEIDAVLVLSKKGPHRQWVEEHLPKDATVSYEARWWKGQRYPLESIDESALQIFTMNWDALRSKKAFASAIEFCNKFRGRLMIVADESQEIKNRSSQRAKAASDLKRFASHRMLSTGTPIAKDLTDEWAQLHWLDENIIGIRYLTTFRANYCVMGGFEGRSVVGHKNLRQFKELTAPYVIRIEKKDVGFVPKSYDDWHFDLTSEQLRLMKELKDEAQTLLKNGERVNVVNAASLVTKMQQVSSGFIIGEDETIHRLMAVSKNPRANAMLEWINANEGSSIVWCRFTEDIAIVREALSTDGINFVEYYGDTSERARKDAIEKFRTGKARIFLANPAAAGTGIDGLQDICSQALYYSNSFNALDRWQSEDRIDRIGMMDGGARYTDLVAAGSPDKYIRRNLQKKEGISNLALRGLEEFLGL